MEYSILNIFRHSGFLMSIDRYLWITGGVVCGDTNNGIKLLRVFILIIYLVGFSALRTNAQIEQKFWGEWEYKGQWKNSDGSSNNAHIIFEFKSDGAVLFSGYVNKVKTTLYGRVVQNLGMNKVRVSYYKFKAGKIKEKFKYESLEDITIIPLSSDAVRIVTVFLPTEYDPEPVEEENTFTRMR